QHVGVLHLAVQVGRQQVFVVDQAGAVAEQVVQGDAAGGGRQRGQPAAQRVVQRQRAVLHQQQDGGGGELLAHRGEAEARVGGDRGALFEVGQAISPAHEGLAVLQHQQRGAGDVAGVAGHHRIDLVGGGPHRASWAGAGREQVGEQGGGQAHPGECRASTRRGGGTAA